MVTKDDLRKEFSERLSAACDEAGVRVHGRKVDIQKELRKRGLSLSTTAVGKWLNAESIPERDRIITLSNWLNVRPEWLEYGRGEMRGAGTKPRDGVPMSEVVGRPIRDWSSADPLEDDEVEIPYYKSIELAAGGGRCENEDYNGFKLRFSRATLRRYGISPPDTAAFPVYGDSMAPIIPNGSTVMVSKGLTDIVDGGVYAIEQDDLFRVKLLYRKPGGKLLIRSYNSEEFPEEEADTDSVKIIGRVFNTSVMLI